MEGFLSLKRTISDQWRIISDARWCSENSRVHFRLNEGPSRLTEGKSLVWLINAILGRKGLHKLTAVISGRYRAFSGQYGALSDGLRISQADKWLFKRKGSPLDRQRALQTNGGPSEADLPYTWWKSKWVLEHKVVPACTQNTLG